MTKEVNKSTVILLRRTLNRLRLLNDFELSFLTSLLRRNYPKLRVSQKQYLIFKGLNGRYLKLDIYERYTDWFRINGFTLNDYEEAYLETYKGEFEKTEAFQMFLKETINRPR